MLCDTQASDRGTIGKEWSDVGIISLAEVMMVSDYPAKIRLGLSRTSLSSPQKSWPSAADQPGLDASDVHLWQVSLRQPSAVIDLLRESLSADERDRASRFHFEIDRQCFIVARGCLRTILSRYLGVAPAIIQFTYNDYGKPQLASATQPSRSLKFNLAHSGQLALYAFTLIGDVGVDLERIRADVDLDELAQKFFSPTEITELKHIPVGARQQAFFRGWARKEAFIKAKGMGLSLALDEFDVSLAAADTALLSTRWDESEAARWSLQEIDVGPEYAAAVAIEAREWNLSCWSFEVNEPSRR